MKREEAWRAHPAFGYRRVDLRDAYLSLTESQLPKDWLALPEEERDRRDEAFFTHLLRSIASLDASGAEVIVDTGDRDHEMLLKGNPSFVKVGPAKYKAQITPATIKTLLRISPTWMRVIIRKSQEVAIMADSWNGFCLLLSPSVLTKG